MTHYLLLKFEPDYMSDALFLLVSDTFAQLQRELDCVWAVHVYRNCITRHSNADVMVEMELSGREALDVYLEHPIHRAFVRKTGPHLAHRAAFDRL